MNKKALADKYIYEGYDYFNNNNPKKAEIAYKKAIQTYPEYEMPYLNLGNVYLSRNEYDQAIKSYKKALSIRPTYSMAETNMAVAYSRSGHFNKALKHLQNVLQTNPHYNMTYIYLGNILLFQGSFKDAEMCFKMAVEKDRNYSESYNNLGIVQVRLLELEKAVESFRKAVKLNESSETYANLGTVYGKLNKIGPSTNALKKAVEINPNDSLALATLYMQLRSACDWDEVKKIEPKLDNITANEIKNNVKTGLDPFLCVIKDANPKKNHQTAKLWSDNLSNSITLLKQFKYKKRKGKKIRVGYVSAHFHDHPTAYLIHTMLGYHDRKKFEIYTYSFGPQTKGFHRSRIMTNSDKFRDTTNANFSDIATVINKDGVDILVDLDGYTDNNRLEIFALRPSPVQVSYLGFPGTTGSNFIDYIITDKIVTPKSHQKYFSEKLIHLPPSYQVNDENLIIDANKYNRKRFRLLKKAFVFACFNGTYKIEPKVFDVWMEILKKTPNSVLWLLKSNNIAQINLKYEAKKRGVHPDRVIFSSRLKRDKHLSRLTLADLALDTFICNGHTTTSDALWANVPVITLMGKHFASRVSSSILTAAGLKDFVTKTPVEYKKLAISLAKNPKKLKKIKTELQSNRDDYPLFNTKSFTKNIEGAYAEIWDLYKKKSKPNSITIKKNESARQSN